ncbi:MAG: hypothetical protein ACRDQA_00235 [Nocardioidaceae bacterium]
MAEVGITAIGAVVEGTWVYSGDATGTTTVSWLPGQRFLVQDGTLTVLGQTHHAHEVIGHIKPFGAAEAEEQVTSRAYTDTGDTLDYTWELDGDTLTIWGGPKGSPAYATGRISPDQDHIAGEWTWPGGGYRYQMTRQR